VDKILDFNLLKNNTKAGQKLSQVLKCNEYKGSYIIYGDAYSGQKMLAKNLSKAIVCTGDITDKPCNNCASCRAVDSLSHMDVIYMDYENENSIGVDDIRTKIGDTVRLKPIMSNEKVYVIFDAEKMTVQAQNSLLKILEEPPHFVHFILTTGNIEKIIPTVQSRVLKVLSTDISDDDLRKLLDNIEDIDEEEKSLIIAFSFGKIERADILLRNRNVRTLYERVTVLLKKFEDGFFEYLMLEFEKFQEEGMDIIAVLDLLKLFFRDVLLFKALKNSEDLVFKSKMQEIKDWANKCSYEGIERILKDINKTQERISVKVQTSLSIELLRYRIKTEKAIDI